MIDWIIDARDANHPVPDQGQRPTCLATAITGAHEHVAVALAEGEALCVEYLHWASGQYPGGRGAPTAALRALRASGQPPEKQWPYNEATDENNSGYEPPGEVVGPFACRSAIGQSSRFDDLVQALREGRWPVLGLRVTDAFAAPGAGIVLPDGPGRAGHAVLVVGAARVVGNRLAPQLLDGEPLLCLRNSWGDGWGKNGHKLITVSAMEKMLITAFALDDVPAPAGS